MAGGASVEGGRPSGLESMVGFGSWGGGTSSMVDFDLICGC